MTKSSQHWSRAYSIFACVCLLQTASYAQEINLQLQIDAASSSLVELDGKAQACLNSLETAATTAAKPPCDDFLQAIDGELLANYLSHCKILKDWRDAFVSTAVNSNVQSNSNENLQLLVGIEFTCGENALQKRTQFVINAFGLLQDGQIQNQRTNANLIRRLAELKFEATLNNERRLLQDSILQQHSTREQATQRQFDDLEKELIRQQIRNH